MPVGPEQFAARRTFTIVLSLGAFLAGALAVALIAALTIPRARDAEVQRDSTQASAEQERDGAAETLEALRTFDERPDPKHDEARAERSQVEGWFSATLRAFALEGVARGWSEVRDDPLPEALAAVGLTRFREQVEALPPSIGRELAEQRDLDDLLDAGIESAGVFTYLDLLMQDRIGPLPELVGDGDRFGALFVCEVSGPAMDGSEFASRLGSRMELASGTTIRFAAGTTRLSTLAPRHELPTCLILEGVGMNATLLVTDDLNDYGRIDRLTLRDCTIFSDGLFDFRSHGAQVLLERVRVIGFDTGAGGSSCLNVERTAFLARDCRFEGGYGRSAGSGGTLFDTRQSSLLARFERCRFDALRLELERLTDRATVVFADCTMIDLRDYRDPRTVEHPGIRLANCTLQLAAPDEERDWSRDLDDLFPGWQRVR